MIGKIISSLKQNQIQLPVWLGVLIARIPFSWRPIVGKIYKLRMKQAERFETVSVEEKKNIIFKQMFEIVKYSLDNIPFYQQFYAKHRFTLDQLKSFDDIDKIPVISKDDLMGCDLFNRSNMSLDKMLVNTGGSSGKTLSFYIEPSAIAHERVHVNYMRRELGFHYYSLRLRIIGQSKVKNGVDYEFARNCYSLNMYQPFANNKDRLMKMLKKHGVDYLQGYPSVLAEFAEFCSQNQDLLRLIKKHLRGILYNSEYPYPVYRDVIESVFQVPSQAFYGHTERCVMAYEKDGVRNIYHVLQTYGYTEVMKRDDGRYDLIGTSYYNHASPLIRYNTNDIVDNPVFESGLLKSFEIIEGRSGQFVTDRDGRKISLTGLIMGRHHSLFEYCDHIQIMQSERGKATILYVPRLGQSITKPAALFDSSNVNIVFEFKQIDKPIRTKSGKVNLLVKEIDQIEE